MLEGYLILFYANWLCMNDTIATNTSVGSLRDWAHITTFSVLLGFVYKIAKNIQQWKNFARFHINHFSIFNSGQLSVERGLDLRGL